MKIILALLLIFLFLSCGETKKDEPEKCKIDLINQNNNTCGNGFVCDGTFCVESKCDFLKITNCNNENMKCDHETGNCISSESYCILEDEIKRQNNSCGLNNSGSQRVICKKWKWVNYTECDDIENCKDGCIDNEVCINGETQNTTTACGLNNEGFIVQKCESGVWVDTTDCSGKDICVNETKQDITCGFNGNGKQKQNCVNGQWENDGNCIDPDECTNDEKKEELNSCGPENSGTQKKICADGQWKNDSCSKPNNEICSDGCIYNAVCENNDVRNTTIVCGLNNEGFIIEECQDGQWVTTERCSGNDECVNGEEQTPSCGLNNRGEQNQICTNGKWENSGDCIDFDICVDDSLGLYELCDFNNNGYVQNKCVTGQWTVENQLCNSVESKMKGNDYIDESNIILSDNNNNIYVVANLNCDGNFENCRYKIYKYDNNLTLLKQSNESLETGKIKSAVLDENGGIIIVGHNYNNNKDLLIERYETTNLTKTHWRTSGTLKEDVLTDVYTYKKTNNIYEYYAVGYTTGEYIPDSVNSSPENRDLFYIKLSFADLPDSSVDIYKEYQLGVDMNNGHGDIIPSKILVDDNYVYISGHTTGNLENGMPNIMYSDLFFVKMNKSSNTINFKKQFSTNGSDGYVHGMKFDSNKEHLYIAGCYLGTINGITTINGDFAAYLMKIKLLDNSVAFKTIEDTTVSDRGYGLFIDSNDYIYITGYTAGNTPNNQNYATGTTSTQMTDIFITKLTSETNKIWTKQLGTNKADEGKGIVVDSTGNIFTVGITRGELGGPNIVGSWNIFISKLSKRLICTIENNQYCD